MNILSPFQKKTRRPRAAGDPLLNPIKVKGKFIVPPCKIPGINNLPRKHVSELDERRRRGIVFEPHQINAGGAGKLKIYAGVILAINYRVAAVGHNRIVSRVKRDTVSNCNSRINGGNKIANLSIGNNLATGGGNAAISLLAQAKNITVRKDNITVAKQQYRCT